MDHRASFCVFVAFVAAVVSLHGCGGGGDGSATTSVPPPPLPADQILSLPGAGQLTSRQFSGYVPVTPNGKNHLFYWFVQAEEYNVATPTLIWINGGPGASSMLGMLSENIGPLAIRADGSIAFNADRLSKKYNLLAVDNPVGAGFSYTENGAYVRSQEEMRTQFVEGLRQFYGRHPEFADHPLWIMGESYAGKYIPNIAYELAERAKEIPLQGVIIGNGLFNNTAAYRTIRDVVFGEGIIDEKVYEELGQRQDSCLAELAAKKETAGQYCENQTVYWLFSDAVAGKLFYYDVGLADIDFDSLTASMSTWLNRVDVRQAFHAGDHKWEEHDETGPVADALRADGLVDSTPQLVYLAEHGFRVALYNGVRDVSTCNHIANLHTLLNLPSWSKQEEFNAARNVPWRLNGTIAGYVRATGSLSFTTLLRTGHLVPTVVPRVFEALIDGIASPASREMDNLAV